MDEEDIEINYEEDSVYDESDIDEDEYIDTLTSDEEHDQQLTSIQAIEEDGWSSNPPRSDENFPFESEPRDPVHFVTEELSFEGQSQAVFKDHSMIVKYRAKSTKTVLLLSTKDHQHVIGQSCKPMLVEKYNKLKWTVNIFDKMQGQLALRTATQRWPKNFTCQCSDMFHMQKASLWKASKEKVICDNCVDKLQHAEEETEHSEQLSSKMHRMTRSLIKKKPSTRCRCSKTGIANCLNCTEPMCAKCRSI
uniref:B box-type domain-containing protein n=1 Tax=Acrobeloides nanus TaxID=290746 RepID=A0A914CRE8_9BILA